MKSRGFTLIELLVVIFIIAVLMSLTVAVLNAVRSRGRTTLCQSRLRNLLLEFEQYAYSENGAFPFGSYDGPIPPPRDGYAGDSRIDGASSWWWFDILEAVNRSDLRDPGTLECPAKNLESGALKSSILWGNYGVNAALCVPTYQSSPGGPLAHRARSRHELRHPAATMLVLDSGYTRISWMRATATPPDRVPVVPGTPYIPGMAINKRPDRELMEGIVDDAISGRHPGKTLNIAFADGHIERRPADDLLVEKREDGTYTNIKPLWEP